MPTIPHEVRDQMLLHQLLAGLPTVVDKQLRATGETKDLNEIIQWARLLLSMEEEHSTAAVTTGLSDVELRIHKQIDDLTEQVAALWQRQQSSRPATCYLCNQPGHVKRNCPMNALVTLLRTVSRETTEGCPHKARVAGTPVVSSPHRCYLGNNY